MEIVTPWTALRPSLMLRRIATWAVLTAACVGLAACVPDVAEVSLDCSASGCVNGASLLYATAVDSVSDTVIVGFRVDSSTGALTAVPGPYPSVGGDSLRSIAVDPSGRFVYAVNTGAPGTLYAYVIGSDGSLTAASPASVPVVDDPYHVAVDLDGLSVWVPNNGSASVSGFAIGAGGGLSALTGLGPGGSPTAIVFHPGGDRAAISLSATVAILNRNPATGQLSNPGVSAAGSGQPLHLSMDPLGDYVAAVYNNADLASIDLFSFDELTPSIALVGTTADICSTASDIVFHPNGQYLFLNCGAGGVGHAFRFDRPSTLVDLGTFPAGGGDINSLAITGSGEFLYHVYPTSVSIDGYVLNAATGGVTQLPGSSLPSGISFFSGALSAY